MRKICIITGTRAEYGLLKRLMKLIDKDDELQLQLIVTNMHLSPEFGLTYREIEKDGFRIDKKVQMLLSGDTSNAIVKSVGLGIIGFADAYEELRPDLLVVLGDRYEILAAVSAALFYKIPVAHIHGGELTEGAYDDAIRHSITKMSHLHFTAMEEYKNRVIQLGEEPGRVFNVGALGIDSIKHLELLSRGELENSLGFRFDQQTILVTIHPETLGTDDSGPQCRALLNVLERMPKLRIIFTLPGADTGGRCIISFINGFVERNQERAMVILSLGQLRYFSVLKFVAAVVGNSSSGIIEVPSFGIPVLNIGMRQRGRLAPSGVVNADGTEQSIEAGIQKVLSADFMEETKGIQNPYEKENTAENIVGILKTFQLNELVRKSFYDLKI